jgi:hypothetical protein
MTFLYTLIKFAIAPVLITLATLHTLAFLLPPTLAGGHPKRLANFFARGLAFLGCLLLCANYGIAASIVFRIIGKPGLAQWATARAFKYTIYVSTGVWMTVEDELGELRTRPMVIVANHQTYVLSILLVSKLWWSLKSSRKREVEVLGGMNILANESCATASSTSSYSATFSHRTHP